MLAITGRSDVRRNLTALQSRGSSEGVRKDLETTSLGLGLARLQLETGQLDDARDTLSRLHQQLQALRREMAEEKPAASLPLESDSQGSEDDYQDCDLLASCLG
jgi:hypothetical protein